MSEIEPYAKALEDEFLEDMNSEKVVEVGREKLRIGLAIEHMYNVLVTVPAVGKTNASKLLHLRLPNLFVMTDTDVRRLFKIFQTELFSAFSYAFNFLRFVQCDINEAIDSLCGERRLSRRDAVEYLRNAHGRTRSLAKLADEYYYTLAHREFSEQYYYPLARR